MAITVRLPMDQPRLETLLAPAAAYLLCDVRFLAKYLAVLWELHNRGVPFKIGELRRRSSTTQAALYAQGRNAAGQVVHPELVVTNAKPGQSYHEKGKAGHIEVDRKYRDVLGQVAEAAGLTWGGRWTTTFGKDGDWQHVEDRGS